MYKLLYNVSMTRDSPDLFSQGPFTYQVEAITANQPDASLSPATYLIADTSPGDLQETLRASYGYTDNLALQKRKLHTAFLEASEYSDALMAESERDIPSDLLEAWDEVVRDAVKDPITHIPSGLLEELFQKAPKSTPAIEQANNDEELRRFEHNEVVTNMHNERVNRHAVLTERDRLNRKLRIASIATGATGTVVAVGGLVEVVSSEPSQDQLMNETVAETRPFEQTADIGGVLEISGVALTLAAAVAYGCRNHYARYAARKLVSRAK